MKSVLQKIVGALKPKGEREPRVPDGTRVYAIGDIHGRMDLLGEMHTLMSKDLQERPVPRSIEIYLGDYVDRGPEPGKVLDTLSKDDPICSERICLKGNHEDTLLRFLDGDDVFGGWKRFGGLETLQAYGIEKLPSVSDDDAAAYRDQMLDVFPDDQRDFITNLPLSTSEGDYFFVHAGVRPGVALDRQEKRDLLWIREEFLLSTADFGKVVVHGHTPVEQPEIRPNRINIDTAAFATGKLTCLVLEGGDRRILSTGG